VPIPHRGGGLISGDIEYDVKDLPESPNLKCPFYISLTKGEYDRQNHFLKLKGVVFL